MREPRLPCPIAFAFFLAKEWKTTNLKPVPDSTMLLPRTCMREDINSVMERDPAARVRSSKFSPAFYPGLWAVWFHRVSERCCGTPSCGTARMLSQVSRFLTEVDIHPGAVLSRRLFIDHATGVIIGQCHRRQRRHSLPGCHSRRLAGKGHGKRHPTLCDNVYVGNNANVIMPKVAVGANSRVGAGSVVLADVPPNSTVVGVPAHIVYRNGERILITDPHDIKDPLSDALIALAARVDELEQRLLPAQEPCAEPFAAEEADRTAYLPKNSTRESYASVSMGEEHLATGQSWPFECHDLESQSGYTDCA